MNKKPFSAVLLFVLSAVMLTGCGASPSEIVIPVSEEGQSSVISAAALPVQSPQSSQETSSEGLTDEELQQMQKADERIRALVKSAGYQKGSAEVRRQLAEQELKALAAEGLVRAESIYPSHDMVSYQYACGAYGGIQLREFDPMMN